MKLDIRPAVPRHWLFAIAGLAWTAVGILLCARSISWAYASPLDAGLGLEAAGIVIALVGYAFGFTRIVKRNIGRIHGLPDTVCAFAFTAWRSYVLIGLMVMIGIALRNSTIPKVYLVVPYTAMGGMLVIGSVRFYRQFLSCAVRRPDAEER